jgi:hypothetical protein
VSFDWEKITAGKEAMRRRLAALPVAEKLRMLEMLRERTLEIKRAKPIPNKPNQE